MLLENKTQKMTQINWNNILIRSSSLSYLFTEPKSKEDKLAGKLSKTAKDHLKETYIREKYGRDKDIQTKAMKKGLECEQDSINLLSMLDGEFYTKNEERFSNGFVTGLPDIITEDTIIDVKTCQDIWTYHDKVGEPIPDAYFCQLQAYMWLTGKEYGKIAYCLTDATPQMVQDELFHAFRKGNYATELAPEYLEKCSTIEKSMLYGDIPLEQRIYIQEVPIDLEFIEKIPSKVEKARSFLIEYDQKFSKNGF